MTLLTVFKSAVTRKLLGHFFAHPKASLYVNEMAKTLSLDKRNLVKKLREFETAGLLKKESRGNMKLYSINESFPLYNEYRGIVLASARPSANI
ncbi:MAG: hypothetical protein M0011_10155 [Elusimicrobia bacterium]|nr:hypothetical protein [Elusimicrobiota bacterium]